MASSKSHKQRYLNTKFWTDNYIFKLDALETYLYIYCLTNPHTHLCGVFEVPLAFIVMETKLEDKFVTKTLAKFEKDGKIMYHEGWLAIKKFSKHQNLKNPQIREGIESGLKSAPAKLAAWVEYSLV